MRADTHEECADYIRSRGTIDSPEVDCQIQELVGSQWLARQSGIGVGRFAGPLPAWDDNRADPAPGGGWQ